MKTPSRLYPGDFDKVGTPEELQEILKSNVAALFEQTAKRAVISDGIRFSTDGFEPYIIVDRVAWPLNVIKDIV